jgi:alpha 1,2-mannosyltransferase
MNTSTILSHREKMAHYLEEKRDMGAFDDPVHVSHGGRGLVGEGRGMVFTAGNVDTLRRVVWTLTLIRKREFLGDLFGCSLD